MAGGGFGARADQKRFLSAANVVTPGVRTGGLCCTRQRGLQGQRVDVRNLLFFMASLPVSGGGLRASPSALTGARVRAKLLSVGSLSVRGTETAKHFP
jgi:hypothetical protein